MKFEWDSKKAALNNRKHGISFGEAVTVFRDPLALLFSDEVHSEHEQREILIGHSVLNRLILVCFTERDEETVRIFSARQATGAERKEYEENTKNQTP